MTHRPHGARRPVLAPAGTGVWPTPQCRGLGPARSGCIVLVGPRGPCARSSMDRASDYGSEGWGFESLRARSSDEGPAPRRCWAFVVPRPGASSQVRRGVGARCALSRECRRPRRRRATSRPVPAPRPRPDTAGDTPWDTRRDLNERPGGYRARDARAAGCRLVEERGLSPVDAIEQAKAQLRGQEPLHGPDQRAGGNPDQITGMGDSGVNRSLGSQWRTRADDVRLDVRDALRASGVDPRYWGDLRMSVRLRLTDTVTVAV